MIVELLQMQKYGFLFPAVFWVQFLIIFKCRKHGFCFQLSFSYGHWACSNVEVRFLFSAIFWVWLLSFFKCRSMVFCFLPSFGYDSWDPWFRTTIFASNYGFSMIIELQIWMYGFFFPPATLWVRFWSSRFACDTFVLSSKAIWTEKLAKVGQVLGYVESPSMCFNTCRKTEKSDAMEIMTCTSNCFEYWPFFWRNRIHDMPK